MYLQSSFLYSPHHMLLPCFFRPLSCTLLIICSSHVSSSLFHVHSSSYASPMYFQTSFLYSPHDIPLPCIFMPLSNTLHIKIWSHSSSVIMVMLLYTVCTYQLIDCFFNLAILIRVRTFPVCESLHL